MARDLTKSQQKGFILMIPAIHTQCVQSSNILDSSNTSRSKDVDTAHKQLYTCVLQQHIHDADVLTSRWIEEKLRLTIAIYVVR